jgi:N-acetylglucosamine kinase-like BadF-type ATPase
MVTRLPGDDRRMTADGPLLIGVDGGNTKTIALVARADGSIVGAARHLGGSDIYAMPPDEAIAAIEATADEALVASAGGGETHAAVRVSAAAFSLAGADWPEDVALLEGRLAGRWPAAVVVNDAIGALRATIPTGPGVVVVCGTGVATGARGPDGTTWHSSFWQLPLGAHELGRLGLQAVVRSELGIDPPTALTAAVLHAAGEPDVESLLHRTTRREGRDRRLVASLAPAVLDAAEHGDPAAITIVREEGVAIGRTALAGARRVGIGGVPYGLALAGGVLRHAGEALRATIVATVLSETPLASVVRPTLEPAAGALLLAFDRAGVAVTPAVEERLRSTLPPSGLFDTHPAAGEVGEAD